MRSLEALRLPSWRRAVSAFLLLLALFQCCRVLFLFLNWPALTGTSIRDFRDVFLLGLRFDLSFLLLWNCWFPVLEFIPLRQTGWLRYFRERLAPRLLFLWNLPPLLVNAVDAGYYGFSGRRSSWGVTVFWNDFSDQALQLLLNFWGVSLTVFATMFAGAWIWRRLVLRPRKPVKAGWIPCLSRLFLVAAILPLGIRSGLQTKPLGTWNAYVFSNSALGAMALNTPFNLMHTERREQLKRLNYFPSEKVAREIIGVDTRKSSVLPENRSNVVLIVLESFGLEHFGMDNSAVGYMPFLRSLASKGVSVSRMYANGRRSIDALASILCGIPALMDEAYVTSFYNSTKVNGLGGLLGTRGYSTSFFHGGRNGSMYLDIMSKRCGFEHYFGLNEYPNRSDFDGAWGIFDEPFLKWSLGKMSEQTEPFVSGLFTLSSHNPYRIPSRYDGVFPKGTQKIHESLGYADYAVSQFFAEAERHPWYKRTLFVLTADHSIAESEPRFQSELGEHRIPLVFFHPGRDLSALTVRSVAQQTDILPSVLDLLGLVPRSLPHAISPFGRSIFDSTARAKVINRSGAWRWGIVGDWYVRTKPGSDAFVVERLDSDGLGSHPVDGEREAKGRAVTEFKAMLQLYQNGLLDNSLFVDSASQSK